MGKSWLAPSLSTRCEQEGAFASYLRLPVPGALLETCPKRSQSNRGKNSVVGPGEIFDSKQVLLFR